MKAERLAQVLHTLTKGKSDTDALSAFESFLSYVRGRGYEKLLPSIMRAYSETVARTKKGGTVVTVAKDRDVSEILKKHDIAGTAHTVIDQTIVGGYQIETESKLIDASHKNALLKIYQRITK